MDRMAPKRAVSLKFEEFGPSDQQLLVAAARSRVTMAIVGFKDDEPYVVSVGHPDGVSAADARPEHMRAFRLSRIRGLAEAADSDAPQFIIDLAPSARH